MNHRPRPQSSADMWQEGTAGLHPAERLTSSVFTVSAWLRQLFMITAVYSHSKTGACRLEHDVIQKLSVRPPILSTDARWLLLVNKLSFLFTARAHKILDIGCKNENLETNTFAVLGLIRDRLYRNNNDRTPLYTCRGKWKESGYVKTDM